MGEKKLVKWKKGMSRGITCCHLKSVSYLTSTLPVSFPQ
jgi:hypothetical protein